MGAITRKSNEIANLPKERTAENIKLVTTLFGQLHEKIINFKDACMEELRKVSDADKYDFSQWMEQHMKKALDYAEVVQRWLQGLEADDIAPEDSASQGGCTNCTQSSTKREKLRERILKAELEEKKAEEENALEEQMLKLKQEKRKINIKYEKEEIRRLEQK